MKANKHILLEICPTLPEDCENIIWRMKHEMEMANALKFVRGLTDGSRWRRAHGFLRATRAQLTRMFGKPETTHLDKSRYQWTIKPVTKVVIYIYDWKHELKCDRLTYSWHVGGNHNDTMDLLQSLVEARLPKTLSLVRDELRWGPQLRLRRRRS